ncbi:antitoxin [Nostocoides sp.]
MFDDIKGKAQDAMADHPDKVEGFSDQGIQKAGDLADGASGGKFGDQIDGAEQKADEAIGE